MSLKPNSFTRTAAPALEPVTIDEAKLHLRLDSDLDDEYITSLIAAAREWAEDFTGRRFITQSWVAKYEGWPVDRVLILPAPPVQSVESITYVDTTGSTVEVDVSKYNLELDQNRGIVLMTQDVGCPSLSRDRFNPVSVELISGYGDTAASVPERVKSAMKLILAHWYYNRVSVNIGNIVNKVPMSAEALLLQLRIRPV